jgi:hypothetical protein
MTFDVLESGSSENLVDPLFPPRINPGLASVQGEYPLVMPGMI